MSLGPTPQCVHGTPLYMRCSPCTRMFLKTNVVDDTPRRSHEFEPWSMRCRGCGNTKAALDNAARDGREQFCPSPLKAVPTRRTRVYVSGPLTTGSMTGNVRAAALAADELLAAGFAVYLPHTNVLWEMIVPPDGDPYEKWLAHDFEWVAACDVILRLDGESRGADREVELAAELKIPVYHTVRSLIVEENTRSPVRR